VGACARARGVAGGGLGVPAARAEPAAVLIAAAPLEDIHRRVAALLPRAQVRKGEREIEGD